MNDITLLKEERKEIQAEIDRLRGSMNRADNGVKLRRGYPIFKVGTSPERTRSQIVLKG